MVYLRLKEQYRNSLPKALNPMTIDDVRTLLPEYANAIQIVVETSTGGKDEEYSVMCYMPTYDKILFMDSDDVEIFAFMSGLKFIDTYYDRVKEEGWPDHNKFDHTEWYCLRTGLEAIDKGDD